jgi:glycine/sarcosine N-methyltransferase
MSQPVSAFYDSLAAHYHLLFEDWNQTIARQARVLDHVLAAHTPHPSLKILDCACGIGTQALGLASLGHQVVASDLSPAAIARARDEAHARSLEIDFYVSNITSLAEVPANDFDVVAAFDNALPHLSVAELLRAAQVMFLKLKPGGLFLASIRDYDSLNKPLPTAQQPSFFGEQGSRRIVHQVWDWDDEKDDHYTLHLYLTTESDGAWSTQHFVSQYRCLSRKELSLALSTAGFRQIEWRMPAQTGFYQPIVLARR